MLPPKERTLSISEGTIRIKARFRSAADRLKETTGATLDDIAAAFGVVPNTVNRWKMDSVNLRPRGGWEKVLAEIAREKLSVLEANVETARRLVDELDPAGGTSKEEGQ